MKDDMKVHLLCVGCKYDCKIVAFANIDICRAIVEDEDVKQRAKELNKIYAKRRSR